MYSSSPFVDDIDSLLFMFEFFDDFLVSSTSLCTTPTKASIFASLVDHLPDVMRLLYISGMCPSRVLLKITCLPPTLSS